MCVIQSFTVVVVIVIIIIITAIAIVIIIITAAVVTIITELPVLLFCSVLCVELRSQGIHLVLLCHRVHVLQEPQCIYLQRAHLALNFIKATISRPSTKNTKHKTNNKPRA